MRLVLELKPEDATRDGLWTAMKAFWTKFAREATHIYIPTDLKAAICRFSRRELPEGCCQKQTEDTMCNMLIHWDADSFRLETEA